MTRSHIAAVDSGEQRSSREALTALLNRQREAFEADPYPSAEQRIEDITRLKDALIKHEKMLAEAMNSDFGCRARDESLLGDVLPSVMGARYAAGKVRKWMKPERRHVSPLHQPAKARVVYQPLGVVGIVVPWNYPVYLAMGPLIAALAAGNRAMIKVSEFAPETGKAVRQVLDECFDEDKVAVIEGDAEVAQAFTALPFDHLLFTGSTAVGRLVMKAAAEHLTPVTLELGGKSPTIIDDEIPMDMAVERFLWGKDINAGQTCVATDYILCPESRVDELLASARKLQKRLYPDEMSNPDFASIINERQFERLSGWLDEVRNTDARVEPLGGSDLRPDPEKRRFPLTAVVNPPADTKVAQEEIFGPLLPIITYRDLEDAASIIRRGTRPLALYVMSLNKDVQEFFIRNTHAGGMCINDSVMQVAQDDLPFGGVGASGIGHYHAREGFLTFSHAKSVFERGKLSFANLVFPPYGRWSHKLVRKLYMR
ncbi:coniferyl aldehyde dehydrogenase [Ectothiorhodospiraceae bacterium WFHF3C12]|nr:coniferyl aldehyde dehydrogenase [Ectothiorhodospiraceae bacterium WFHF3C12]